MRSVFVHLWDTTEEAVATVLDQRYPARQGGWVAEVDRDPCLYVAVYRDGRVEDENWADRFSMRGGPPDVCVIADVSGRHEGTPQVRAFVIHLLDRFGGVATDDDWSRLWSKEEVAANQIVDGRRFGSWRA